MAMTGIEPVVREVLDVLEDGLPAELAALEAEYADGITLAVPGAGSYFWHVPTLIPAYPAVIVMPLPEAAVVMDMATSYQMTYAIRVDIVTRHVDVPTTDVALWRYWRAVKGLLVPLDALTCGRCVLSAVDWSQPVIVDQQSGDELRDVPGLFRVTTYETTVE